VESNDTGGVDAELKRKYELQTDSQSVFRRTAGSYSFEYEDMNSILKSLHFERQKRREEGSSEMMYHERLEVVCDIRNLRNSICRNASTNAGTDS
jgi:hypothetical protein